MGMKPAWAAVVFGGLLAAAACTSAKSPEERPEGFATPEHHPVTAELVVEHASIQPGGSTRLGVHFEMEKGWHIYGKEPGDAGLPTKITWASSPEGVASFGPIRWPPYKEFRDPGNIRTFGYSAAVVLSSPLTLTPVIHRSFETLLLHAHVQWLACKDICIPGSADLELALPVSAAPPAFSTHAQLFEHTDAP